MTLKEATAAAPGSGAQTTQTSAFADQLDAVEFNLNLRGCRIGDALEMHEIALGDEEVFGRAFFDAKIDHRITELFEDAESHRAAERAVIFEAPYTGAQQPVRSVKQHLAVARPLPSSAAVGRAAWDHRPAMNRKPSAPQASLDRAGSSGKDIAGPRAQSASAEREERAILTNPVELETKSRKVFLDGRVGGSIQCQLLEQDFDLRRVLDDPFHAIEDLQLMTLDVDLDQIAAELGPEQIVEPPDLRLNSDVTGQRSGPIDMAAAQMPFRLLESCRAVAVG